MKFPSLFRTNTPMRFDIKPRYYDPVKEEIEQRTSRIKKELAAKGELDENDLDRIGSFGSGIKGSFAQHKGIRERSGENAFTSTAMIRTFIFLILVGSIFGYIYLGPVIFEFLLYGAAIVFAIYFFFKLKSKRKNNG